MIKKRSILIKKIVNDENSLFRLLTEKELFWKDFIDFQIENGELDPVALKFKCPSKALLLREIEDNSPYEVYYNKEDFIVINEDRVLYKKEDLYE